MIILAALLIAVSSAAADDAPSFCLPDLSRQKVCLEELIKDGPLVLDFWATWCGPCVKALPHLQALSEEFADRGVTVIGMCADSPKTVSRVPGFVQGRKLTFPILMDTDNEVMRRYKIANLPYTCIVDTSGTIVYSHLGYKPGDERELRVRLLTLLGETECDGR
ncbi:TlpA family protein disulfide reductase [Candidatus Fermentibacteria bacterium]|nr:TlpA family protein disulfide reductase [Candidatus Fermentibacteria bacterium]